MPTIKFELRDPKYCNFCYCLDNHFTNDNLRVCRLLPMVKSERTITSWDYVTMKMEKDGKIKRPQECIDKFGK